MRGVRTVMMAGLLAAAGCGDAGLGYNATVGDSVDAARFDAPVTGRGSWGGLTVAVHGGSAADATRLLQHLEAAWQQRKTRATLALAGFRSSHRSTEEPPRASATVSIQCRVMDGADVTRAFTLEIATHSVALEHNTRREQLRWLTEQGETRLAAELLKTAR